MKVSSITVYLGSSGRTREVFKTEAADMGRLIAQKGKNLVYGGMDAGLMGILADTALKEGGHVLGIVPRKIKDITRFHNRLSDNIIVDDLWERKLRMFQEGDAIVVLPGGYGTLDEALEVMWWASQNWHNKPVIFVNTENYWNKTLEYIKENMPEAESTFALAKNAEEIFSVIEDWPEKETKLPKEFPNFEDDITRETNEPIIIREASLKEFYKLMIALVMRQVGAIHRHIGLIDKNDSAHALIDWIETAKNETFITHNCPELLKIAKTEKELLEKLKGQEDIKIDLLAEKWNKPDI